MSHPTHQPALEDLRDCLGQTEGLRSLLTSSLRQVCSTINHYAHDIWEVWGGSIDELRRYGINRNRKFAKQIDFSHGQRR